MAKRVRPARIYQRPDEPIRLIAHRGKAKIRRDMKSALKHLQSIVPDAAVKHQLRAGSFFNVKEVINWPHFGEVLKAVFERIAQVREAGAALGVRKINGAFHARRRRVRFQKHSSAGWLDLTDEKGQSDYALAKAGSVGGTPKWRIKSTETIDSLFDLDAVHKADIGSRFNFDRFDSETQDRVRAAQDALIRQLTVDARNTIDAIVSAGVRTGLSVEEMAADIREFIGLTDRQAQAVMNYRTMLEGLDSGALARQLRNFDLDAAVRAAISNGQPLDAAFIERAVRDYESNYLDYRANAISQTESVRAASAGLEDSYRQAIERGALPANAVRRYWQVDLTENTCPVCLSIPDKNESGVAVGEAFDSIEGPVDEPPVHPHCNCSVEYVTDLDMVADTEAAA